MAFIWLSIHNIIDLYSYVWGGIADCIGRKPVLIASGVMLTLTSILFGFSVNFVMCVLARFGMGLSCGKCTLISVTADLHTHVLGWV